MKKLPSLRRYRVYLWFYIFIMMIAVTFIIAGGIYLTLRGSEDTSIDELIGTVMLAPFAAVIFMRFKRASARVQYAQITPEQYPYVHAEIVRIAKELGLKRVPEAYLVADNPVNPCVADMGARPVLLLGSDFLAGCRENERPEALRFMIAHQLGHIAAGHNRWLMEMVSGIALYVPLMKALFARNMEFTADVYAGHLYPKGAVDALGLCAVGKDNFPYINGAVHPTSARLGLSPWLHVARWVAGNATAADRLLRLQQRGLVTPADDRPIFDHEQLLGGAE